MFSCSGWDYEKVRKVKEEIVGRGVERTNRSPAKVSDKSLKQAKGPCYPLFWGSHSEQGAQEQAQVKASRRNLVSLSEIFASSTFQVGKG